MKNLLWAHLALGFVSLVYGANYVIAKDVMPTYIGPSGFIVLRAIGATFLFWVLQLFIREKVDLKDMGRLFLCGVFGVAINQLLFFNGLSHTSPINAAAIMTSNPILVLVIASVLLKEKITSSKLAGILIGASGAVLIIYTSSTGKSTMTSVKGDIMVLVNAISYGIYLVIAKPLMKKYQATTVIGWVFLFGLVLVLPFGYKQFAAVDWSSLDAYPLFAMGYVVVGTTFLAYLLNIYALKTVSPSVVSSYIYLQPVIASLFAFLHFRFGSEIGRSANYTADFSIDKLLYTMMIFIGVYLVSKKSKPRE